MLACNKNCAHSKSQQLPTLSPNPCGLPHGLGVAAGALRVRSSQWWFDIPIAMGQAGQTQIQNQRGKLVKTSSHELGILLTS